jgi:predicted N-acetyltransferase YhbS
MVDKEQIAHMNEPKVQLRRATPEDAEACGRIFHEAFSGINNQHRFPPEVPTVESAIGILTMLFSHPGFHCVLAEGDGQIVGSVCQDERSTIAGVGPLSIAPDVQNRGIGRILAQSMIDRAKERGLSGTRLLQAAFHNRALSLYAKLGFTAREPLSVMAGLPLKKRRNQAVRYVQQKRVTLMAPPRSVIRFMVTVVRPNCVKLSTRGKHWWSREGGN